jgi:hypothetical protein
MLESALGLPDGKQQHHAATRVWRLKSHLSSSRVTPHSTRPLDERLLRALGAQRCAAVHALGGATTNERVCAAVAVIQSRFRGNSQRQAEAAMRAAPQQPRGLGGGRHYHAASAAAGGRGSPSSLHTSSPRTRDRGAAADWGTDHVARWIKNELGARAWLLIRVRVEIIGALKCRNVGESQSVLIMIDPIISTRTRICYATTDGSCRAAHHEAMPGGMPVREWFESVTRAAASLTLPARGCPSAPVHQVWEITPRSSRQSALTAPHCSHWVRFPHHLDAV